jgi:hypothetical protein
MFWISLSTGMDALQAATLNCREKASGFLMPGEADPKKVEQGIRRYKPGILNSFIPPTWYLKN